MESIWSPTGDFEPTRFPEKTVPLVVQEFAKRCRQLLGRDGYFREATNSTRMRGLGMWPLWMHGMGGDDGLLELFVSLPGPASDPGTRTQIYEEGRHGHHWDEQQCAHYLPMVRRRLVLEELSEIPDDDG